MADKVFELVYSTQKTNFMEGRAYSNPRFFQAVRLEVTKVFVVGEWPNVVKAYKAAGIEVVELAIGQNPDMPDKRATRAAVLSPVVQDPAIDTEIEKVVKPALVDERAAIEIPEGWDKLAWPQLQKLARNFSAEPTLNKPLAKAAISAELERRAALVTE